MRLSWWLIRLREENNRKLSLEQAEKKKKKNADSVTLPWNR